MFVLNTTDKDIGPISFEGFNFLIPQGVSSIYTPAGKWFTTHNFKCEVKDPKIDGGAPLPPLLDYDKVVKENPKLWDGKYCEVTRVIVEARYIPNPQDQIRLAEKRGVAKELIARWRNEEGFDEDEVVKAINSLPVPDNVRFPDKQEEKKK